MGQQRFDKPDDWEKIRQEWLFDDFKAYLDTFTWTKFVQGTGSTVSIGTGPRSFLVLGGGTVAGNEAAVFATNKFWQWSANHPTHAIFRINSQEANVNNQSLVVGFTSINGTGLVTNANPNALNGNFTGCGFFLPAGSTNWSVFTSVGTTQIISATLEAAVPTGDQYLMVQADVVGTNVEATFMVGNADPTGGADSVFPTGWQQARESLSGFNKAIKHRVAYSGAAQMTGGVYLRQTSATAETVNVDFVGLLNMR